MFKIYDGREHFYQWDLDRKLIVGDRTIQAVHFCNRTGASAITRDCYDVNGMWLVDVPNLCLQESYRLKVYGFSAAKYTTVSSQFDVKSRTKPDGYVYTDDEVNCWQDLDQRVAALEENPVEQEVIDTAIEAYFAANPIEKGATDAEKEQIARNAEDIAALKAQADTYATEEYVDAAVANIEVGGGGECAIEIVNATGDETIELDKTYDEVMAMVEAGKNVVINYDGNLYHQFNDRPIFRYVGDMETRQISFNPRDYSVRYSEAIFPTYEDVGTIVEEAVADFQTAEQVEEAINAAKPDLTGYATETYVNDALAGIDVDCNVMFVNTNNGAIIQFDKTYAEIKAAVDEGKTVIIRHNNKLFYLYQKATLTFCYLNASTVEYMIVNNGSCIYRNYKIATLDDIANFQTAEQVNAAIETYVGVIENGTY